MPLTVPLDDASTEHGGKAASLGALRRAGLPVPDGFVVPASVRAADLPRAASQGLATAVDTDLDEGGTVAVRSSAPDEDGPLASAAGQYETVLGAVGAREVVAAVLTCRASAAAPRAVAYRSAMTGGAAAGEPPAVAVLVQRLVDARAAGVLFTGNGAVIEASWGLGQSVVQGVVDPDRFTVSDGRVVERRTGAKRTRVDRSPGGTATHAVAPADQQRPCLDEATVLRVAALGERVADLLGGPQDVEWAVDDGGTVWLLQARQVTTPLPAPHDGWNDRGLLRGTPGSGGRADGPVRVVRGPDDFPTVRTGDVLVCRTTDPAWTPLFGIAAAVVTETGGLLSHAAIVARELRLPAVLGVPDAIRDLTGAASAVVDGGAGTVEPLA